MSAHVNGNAWPIRFFVNGEGEVDFTLIEDDGQPTDPKRGEEEATEDGERVGDGGGEMRLGRYTYRWLPTELVIVLNPSAPSTERLFDGGLVA